MPIEREWRWYEATSLKAEPKLKASCSYLCPQGCMKSGQVLTERRWKWYEPEYWRFGDPAGTDGRINYMRHASGVKVVCLIAVVAKLAPPGIPGG